jgi:hypothetical protein
MSYSSGTTIADLAKQYAAQQPWRPQAPNLLNRAPVQTMPTLSLGDSKSDDKQMRALGHKIGNVARGYGWNDDARVGSTGIGAVPSVQREDLPAIGVAATDATEDDPVYRAGGGIADAEDTGSHIRAVGPGSRGGRGHFSERGGGFLRGLVHSATPGRADHVGTKVRRKSYVVPADIVSGLGQGNTMAGANVLEHAAKSHGINGYARGGDVDEPMDVQLSGGEYVYEPEEVMAFGRGDYDAGREALDNLVHAVRQHYANAAQQLPPPK